MRYLAALVAAGALLLAACGTSADDRLPTVADAPTTETAPRPETVAPPPRPSVPGTRGTTPQVTTTLDSATTTAAAPLVPLDALRLELEIVADGFAQPVFVTAPSADDRLFVVDQPGVVWVIDGGDPEQYLDIRDRTVFGGEQGLLGLAFPPDHGGTGRFYVNYTGTGGATRVSEFRAEGNVADPSSERIVLEVAQPAGNHNGGMIAFGPEGHLWIGMGDGGSRDDRFGNGQDGATLLGSMLRIDPEPDPYAIPAGNPGTVDPDWAAETWAIGLRNPWRFSFDGTSLWIGDVGQDEWEEVDVIDVTAPTGANLGWPLFEGAQCYRSSDCDATGLVAPVLQYPHGEGCSIVGGYVYRGSQIPELAGHYVFGDFCGGWIRGLAPDGEVIEWFGPGSVRGLTSFGIGPRNEVYVTSAEGLVYRLARAAA